MLEPPDGAISQEQRLLLMNKSHRSGYKWAGKRGFYMVVKEDGDLVIGGQGDHKFSFDWGPRQAYYFTNYFHALGYSLRLKTHLKEEAHVRSEDHG